MHLSVEGLRPWDWPYPVLAVPPGVTHSDSHHLWYEHCRKTSTTTTSLPMHLKHHYFDERDSCFGLLVQRQRLIEKWSWFLSLILVYPVLQYRRERPLFIEFGLISDGWLGLYISFGRLSQCTWVLKVSVLETGPTQYCSISGSDPLRQSSSLTWNCR